VVELLTALFLHAATSNEVRYWQHDLLLRSPSMLVQVRIVKRNDLVLSQVSMTYITFYILDESDGK
jgi:hypothetical protein